MPHRKKPQFLFKSFKKAGMPLKMYLKSLVIFENPSHLFEKTFIFLKMSSK
jgi:hypothetical protein